MTGKDYLERAYRITEMIGEHMQEIKKLHLIRDSLVSSGAGGVCSSPDGNANYTKVIEKIIDYENEIRKKNAELLDTRIELRKLINNVKNVDYNLILKKRYLQFMTFEGIANDLAYTERHIYRLHDKAVEAFEKVNKDVIECHGDGLI